MIKITHGTRTIAQNSWVPSTILSWGLTIIQVPLWARKSEESNSGHQTRAPLWTKDETAHAPEHLQEHHEEVLP